MKLLPRQRIFVSQYLPELNATRAAIAAGYSPKTAASQGSRLLRNVKVRAEIEAGTAKITEKYGLSAERVLQGIANLAFFDPRDLYNQDGSLKSITELGADTAAAITGMHTKEIVREHDGQGAPKKIGIRTKIRFADRGRNLERLGRYFGLFTKRVEVGGLDTLAEDLQKARLRAHSRPKT